MIRPVLAFAMLVLAAALVPAASAKDKKAAPASNALTDAVAACRQVSDPAARLACYDQASARLAEAIEAKNVVVMDRQEIRQTRRSLFGFSLPRIPLFRGDAMEDQDEITATISSAVNLGQGKWQIRLEDGAIWQTTEARMNLTNPRAGQSVVIKRGALGNYFLRINGQRGISGKRVG